MTTTWTDVSAGLSQDQRAQLSQRLHAETGCPRCLRPAGLACVADYLGRMVPTEPHPERVEAYLAKEAQ